MNPKNLSGLRVLHRIPPLTDWLRTNRTTSAPEITIKSVLQHAFNRLGGGGDLFGAVNRRHHNWQVARYMEKARLALVTLGAISKNASVYRGAGNFASLKLLNNSLMKEVRRATGPLPQ